MVLMTSRLYVWGWALLGLLLLVAPLRAQDEQADSSPDAPVLQYVVAVLCSALVLVIVCKPSRKA